MTIAERHVDDVTVLELAGRLIMNEGEQDLRKRVEQLVAQGQTRLILDLRKVVYIDSAGLGQIVAKYLSVRRSGGDMKLLHLSDRAHHVMDITKLLDVFETYETEDEAIRSFAVHGRS